MSQNLVRNLWPETVERLKKRDLGNNHLSRHFAVLGDVKLDLI